jgi:hypothetical protein
VVELAGFGQVRVGNRVKAFSLSGSGRVSQVRLAGLSGFVGFAGLSSDKAKTPPRAGFILIPQPKLG